MARTTRVSGRTGWPTVKVVLSMQTATLTQDNSSRIKQAVLAFIYTRMDGGTGVTGNAT